MARRVSMVVPLALLAALLAAAPALADEIRFTDGRPSLPDIEVVSETYEAVTYKIKGSMQTEPSVGVAEIVHDNASPRYSGAERKLQKGDWKGAIDDFQAVTRERLRDEQAWMKHYALFKVAEAYRLAGDAAAAVEAYQATLADNPKSRFYAPVKLGLGASKLAGGDMPGARAAFSELEGEAKAKKLGDRWADAASLALAEVLELDGKTQEALDRFRRCAAAAKGSAAARASCNVQRLSAKTEPARADAAAGAVQSIVQGELKKKDGPDLEVLAAAYNALGDIYAAKDDWKTALLSYLRVALDDDLKRLANERPKALYCAAQAFEKAKTEDWKNRAEMLKNELRNSYPGSPWARK